MLVKRQKEMDTELDIMNLYVKVIQHGKCGLTRYAMESLIPKRAQFISNEDVKWINLPKEELWMKGDIEEETKNNYIYIFESRGRIVKIRKLITENLGRIQVRYKRYHDGKDNKRKFKMENIIFILLPTSYNKLLIIWIDICKVIIEKEKNNYSVEIKEKINTLHKKVLKKCIQKEKIMEEVRNKNTSLISMEEQQEDKRRKQRLIEECKYEEGVEDIKTKRKLLIHQKKDIKKTFIKYKEMFTELTNTIRKV